VQAVTWPVQAGIRVDTHIAAGSRVPPYYDSLMAKIIAHASDRPGAVSRLQQALRATRLSGVRTNIDFQSRILAAAEFQAGGFDTGFVARLLESAP
jgi:acetyl-CoA carboxylase biotin carboxylase subunit